MAKSQIRPLEKADLEAVKAFTDTAIGSGYYSLAELQEIYEKSLAIDGTMTTLVLIIDGKLCGIRITYPPGKWNKGKGRGLSPKKWPHDLQETAYFQSLFVDSGLTGQGYGKMLSLSAMKILKGVGAKGVVCHSWKESPHDSSGKYLRSLGFQLIETHPLYWKEVDYVCTRCGKPCLCTAEEMYLKLE
jgi:ribosomal protein S18 acetylase RimI-like enzyme